MNRKRIDSIAFLKVIMMISVVLYHSILFFGGTWFKVTEPIIRADYLGGIAEWMKTFHIQAFTMASGYLFFYLKRYGNDNKTEIAKRAKRLLIPFLFTCLFWVIPIGYYFFSFSPNEILYNFVLAVKPNQLWFLIMLFNVFLFFQLFGYRIKMKTRYLIIVYFITVSIYLAFQFFNIGIFQLPNSALFVLYFYFGGFTLKNKEKITKKQIIIMMLLAATTYGSQIYLNMFNNKVLNAISTAIGPITSVLECSVLYWLCSKIVKRIDIFSNKIFRVLEKNSFGIFLFHQQIIYFTIIWLNGHVHPIVQVSLSFIISLAISTIISSLLRRFKVTRVMFGL